MAKSWLKVGVFFPLVLLLGACNALLETPSPLEVSLSFPREVAPGETASGTLTVRSSGYTGQASLRLVSPTGFTLVEPSTIDISSGNNEYPVRVQVGSSVQPRTYEVVLELTPRGGAPIQARGTLRVTSSGSPPGGGGGGTPGLTAQVDPSSLTVYQGGTGNLTLTLTPSGGLTGLVLFRLENGGSPVSWASLSPDHVNITSAGQRSVSLTLSVASEAPEGAYNLTLKVIHSAGETRVPLSLTVKAPTFNISLSRTAFTIIPGGSTTLRLTITNEGGFSGRVSFSLVGGSDARSLSLVPTEVEITPDDTTIVVPLTVTADTRITPGEYPVYLRATSGTITRRVLIDVTVPEPPYFNVEVSPATLEVPQGGTGTLTLVVTPLHGFTGTLDLRLENIGSSLRFDLFPPSVSVSGSASQSYALLIRVPEEAETRSYFLRLVASALPDDDRMTSHSNLIEVRVTAP
jgi:hypothetical protein